MASTLYGRPHVRARARWAPRVAAGRVDCWRCGQRIQTGQLWDLGHRSGLPSRPEHTGCNRSAGGREGARRVWTMRRQATIGGSRQW